MNLAANYLPEVKEQYEDLPYPPRNPDDEKSRLVCTFIDMPERLNHFCYGGRQLFENFRVLVAGGGTGDATIYMAEMYADLGAEIVHLDLSAASIAIARQRAEIRGVEKHIRFVQGSLLDVSHSQLGTFDYISCTGVLHHLTNPEEGLAALTSILKPDGVIAIMVYAAYGRLAIYPLQKALKLALKDVTSPAEKIRLAREMLKRLPQSNWYRFCEDRAQKEIATDNGFYDLLLHSQDRAYTVPEIYSFAASAGLEHVSMQCDFTSGAFYYDPMRMVTGDEIKDEFSKLALPERQALAELLCGNMPKHFFYASRSPFCEPDPKDETCVPVASGIKAEALLALQQAALSANRPFISYRNQKISQPAILHLHPSTAELLSAIDNERSTGEIIHAAATRCHRPNAQVKEEFLAAYETLRRDDILFLRHGDSPMFKAPEAMHKRMKERMGYEG